MQESAAKAETGISERARARRASALIETTIPARLDRLTWGRFHTLIVLALGIKVVFIGMALAGTATMWMAVFADMGASMIVVFNGLRLLRKS